MGALLVLRGAARIGRTGTIEWNSPPMLAVQLIVIPFSQISFFFLLGQSAGYTGSSLDYIVLGNAVQPITTASVFAVASLVTRDKYQGTLVGIVLCPANRLALFVGRSLFQIVVSLLIVSVGILMAATLFGIPLGNANYAGLILSLSLTAVSMVGFGLLVSSVGLYLRTVTNLSNVLLFLTVLVCGVNFPVSQLPSWLRPVSYAIPLTYGLSAVRNAIQGAPVASILPLLLKEVAVGLGLVAGAYGVLTSFERVLRRTGRFDVL